MFQPAFRTQRGSFSAPASRCGDVARLDVLNQWWRGSWWRVTPPAVPFASVWDEDS